MEAHILLVANLTKLTFRTSSAMVIIRTGLDEHASKRISRALYYLIVLLTSAVNSSEINGITKQASGFGVFDDFFVLHVLRLPVVMVSAA